MGACLLAKHDKSLYILIMVENEEKGGEAALSWPSTAEYRMMKLEKKRGVSRCRPHDEAIERDITTYGSGQSIRRMYMKRKRERNKR